MKRLSLFLVLLMGLCTACSVWAEDVPFQEGVQYSRITTPQPTQDPGKIEVLEVFWYGCPHCYHLEPDVEKWLTHKPDDVDFVRLPAIPGKNWEWLAKVYFTAEVLGVLEKIHNPLFKAIHEEKRNLKDADSMAPFFAGYGVSKEEFLGALDSFAVVVKVNRARELTRRYEVSSVPMFIVNGKYRTSGSMAGTTTNMFAVMDYLIKQERPTSQSKATGNP